MKSLQSVGSTESFSFCCNFNKNPIQWHLLLPFENSGGMWHCLLNRFITHTATALFRWCFSPKFCTVSYFLPISLISFEVRASSTFFSSSKDEISIKFCFGDVITQSPTARERERRAFGSVVSLWCLTSGTSHTARCCLFIKLKFISCLAILWNTRRADYSQLKVLLHMLYFIS